MTTSAHVRVRVSFNGLRKGDEARLVLTPRVRGWIKAKLVEVIEHGEDQAGPGESEPDTHERVQDGAEGSGPASREPGQGFGTGAYGAPA